MITGGIAALARIYGTVTGGQGVYRGARGTVIGTVIGTVVSDTVTDTTLRYHR